MHSEQILRPSLLPRASPDGSKAWPSIVSALDCDYLVCSFLHVFGPRDGMLLGHGGPLSGSTGATVDIANAGEATVVRAFAKE